MACTYVPNTIIEPVYESKLIADVSSAYVTTVDKETRYKCPECDRSFLNVGPLKCHYLKAHRDCKPFLFINNVSLTCQVCKKTFPGRAELTRHTKRHIKKSETPDLGALQCDICHKYFAWKLALEKHYLTHKQHKTYACDICQRKFDEVAEYNQHYKEHSQKQVNHNCDKCFEKPPCKCGGKTVSSAVSSASFIEENDHDASHTTEKLFKCDVCFVGFSNQGNLNRHANVHSNKRPFQCEICKKSFRLRGNLKQHRIVHSKERSFQCKVCNKVFKRKGILEVHERTHSNEKPYVCQKCNKGFTQLSGLKSHYLVHLQEKPFPCDLCKKSFSNKNSFKVHQLRHKLKQGLI